MSSTTVVALRLVSRLGWGRCIIVQFARFWFRQNTWLTKCKYESGKRKASEQENVKKVCFACPCIFEHVQQGLLNRPPQTPSIFEGSLNSKLPTIWTVEKQSSQVSRKKMQ